MAIDIVIQLRELASSIDRGDGLSTLHGAAGEIERLRTYAGSLERQIDSLRWILLEAGIEV